MQNLSIFNIVKNFLIENQWKIYLPKPRLLKILSFFCLIINLLILGKYSTHFQAILSIQKFLKSNSAPDIFVYFLRIVILIVKTNYLTHNFLFNNTFTV